MRRDKVPRACTNSGVGLGNLESAATSLVLSPHGTTCEGFLGSFLLGGRSWGRVCISTFLLFLPELTLHPFGYTPEPRRQDISDRFPDWLTEKCLLN